MLVLDHNVHWRVKDSSRALIAALSFSGLMLEGWLANILIMSGMLIWLWLPEFNRLLSRVSE